MGEDKKKPKASHSRHSKDAAFSRPNEQAQAAGTPADETAGVAEVTLQELEALKGDLEAAQAKAGEYFEGWQRERADFANYKRRVEREQSQMSQNLAGNIIKKYLVVIDDMERALKTRPNVGEGGAWSEGIDLIYRKLINILEAEGVTRMPAETEMFDPNRHEAIMQEDSPDHESGQIIEVVQPGYLLGERVLRPALVRVAS
jgi:molecular chaperone GrpE